MSYYITLTGGTQFEFIDSMHDRNFQYSPTNIVDKSPYYPGDFPYIKPYGGVSTPPPIIVERAVHSDSLPRNDAPYNIIYQRPWGPNTIYTIEYRLYWYQGDRWGFPTFSMRYRITKNGVDVVTGNLYNVAGGADGYIALIIGMSPYNIFSVGGAPYYEMSYRVELSTGGASTSAQALQWAHDVYDIEETAGWTGYAQMDIAAHDIFSKAWLDNVIGGGADPVYNPPGYYHGAIDGGTPARQFIRGGINYLRTIDIYDETYYTHGSNAAFLKNKVGELAYNGVEFAYPNIIVKANTSLQFTHAVTASWSANNRPVVYEVIGYHEIGNNLAEYTLRVDGLKTFYQYHTDKNPLVARHSNIANWNKWGIQNVPPSTTYRTGRKKINLANNLSLGGGWVCLVIGTKVYCLSSDDFNSITSWINAQDSPNYIYSQITRVFKSPFPGNAPGIGRSSISGITFNSINADGESILVTWSATSSYECYTTGVSSMVLSLESGIINSGVDLDNGEFTIFIPAYGDIKPSREALTLLAKGETLTLFYYMSLYTGETAVRLSCDTDVLPYVSLPTVDLQISTASQQIRLLNQSQENSRTSTAVGVGLGVAGLVASLATGNVAGAMGASSGLISSLTGATLQTSNQAIQMQQALLNARSEVIAIGAAVGYRNADTQGGTNNDIELSYKIAEPLTNLDNYYATVGYPCGLPLLSCTTVSGDTIWLAWNRATLNDKKEIVDDLLIKSSEGIYWNP